MPRILVDRPEALSDKPLKIAVIGCRPGETVELSSTRVDFNHRFWRAWGRYRADGRGRIELARDAPLDGSYRSVSAMGLFWSMALLEDNAPSQAGRDIAEGLSVRLYAKGIDSGARGEIELSRRFTGPGVKSRELRQDGLVGRVFLPEGKGPHPTVIVLSGSSGGLNLVPAALLASHGYAALALGYFALPGLPGSLDEIPLEYFGRALDWLRRRPRLFSDFVAVAGTSRGGELALLLGATFPAIRAVVCFVASGLLHAGLGQSAKGRHAAAWTHGGKPLPALEQGNDRTDSTAVDWDRPPVALTPVFRSSLRDRAAVERATIPVERIAGPVLLVSGDDDAMWPSVELSEIATRRLAEHGHPYPVRHLVCAGAGHRIYPPYAPTTLRWSRHPILGSELAFGGSAEADAAACAESWPQVLDFLDEAVEAAKRRPLN